MRLPCINAAPALVASVLLSAVATAGELDGSAWRLVNIASMDDTNYAPDDPANYLAQFEWVRSYVMKDGHLFLATMADGAIIEFEPLPPVVATVLGEEVRANDVAEMQSTIIARLFARYAAERGIKVEEAELASYLGNMRRGMAAEGLTAGEEDLSPDEKRQVDAMRREMGSSLIRQWKINKSLHEAYGGRIIYQQLGPEPLDAYRQYLEERQKAGDFRIDESAMKQAFWQYFTDDSQHDFMKKGSADEARAFATSPWE
ncbi:MAG: hypothetical protein JNK40_11665 [Chromatiales bacterium]|nr:hypothetical protein [Chromatiales bacterium]